MQDIEIQVPVENQYLSLSRQYLIDTCCIYAGQIFDGNGGRATAPQWWLRNLLGEDGVCTETTMRAYFPQVRFDLWCTVVMMLLCCYDVWI